MRRIAMMALGLPLVGGAGSMGAQDVNKMREESRGAANQLVAQLRVELLKIMDTSGPLRAIIVCKYSAPEITSALSRSTGSRVTRVSLTPRNSVLGAADSWEQRVLMEFEERVTKGEKADNLEHAEVVIEPQGRFFRYMKALATMPLCTACHGPADQLSDAVKAVLHHEYPHDRAIGYRVGQVLGAVSVKRPLN